VGITFGKYTDIDCPEIRHKRANDEVYDICNLNGKRCLIEHGLYECDFYDYFLKEAKDGI